MRLWKIMFTIPTVIRWLKCPNDHLGRISPSAPDKHLQSLPVVTKSLILSHCEEPVTNTVTCNFWNSLGCLNRLLKNAFKNSVFAINFTVEIIIHKYNITFDGLVFWHRKLKQASCVTVFSISHSSKSSLEHELS